jgi:hypothetical protein
MVMARRWGRKFSSQFSVLGLELRTSDFGLKAKIKNLGEAVLAPE